MVKCIIVDDESPAREELKYLLQEFENIEMIGEASHGLEAIELNEKLKPDLMFLDIQMPKISGIEVAQKMIKSEHVPLIVFVTAFEEFAIKAFEVNAIDYLLKPISKERLRKNIEKVIDLLKFKNIAIEEKLEKFLTDFKNDNANRVNKISVYNNGILIPLDPNEIIYATVEERNTVIISIKGRYESNNTLSQLEGKLNSSNFFRCHKSFLVNLDYISEIAPWFNGTFVIKMKSAKAEIPVSRGHAKEFKKIMDIF